MSHPFEQKIQELNITLPEPLKPVGAYHPLIVANGFGFLSGQVSKDADGKLWVGKVGAELTLEEGQKAARAAALNAVSVIKSHVGFERLVKIARVVGYVQCDPRYAEIHKVVNGASEVFGQIFGDVGIHARSAVGMASLPLNAAVEIEVTIEVKS